MMVGGWNIDPKYAGAAPLPQKVAIGFTKAFQGLTGASYTPVIYCGTQVVSGTNHMIICEAKLTTNPSVKKFARLFFIRVYQKKANSLFCS